MTANDATPRTGQERTDSEPTALLALGDRADGRTLPAGAERLDEPPMPTEDGRTVTRRQLSHMIREGEFRAGDACFEGFGTAWYSLPERGVTAEDVARYRNVAAWWTAIAAHAALLADD